MNRRGFLRLMGLAPVALVATKLPAVAAPVVEPAAKALLAGEIGLWQGIEWIEKEFDYGTATGFCMVIQHPRTGEIRRNAVLVHHRLNEPGGTMARYRQEAKRLLRAWMGDQDGIAISDQDFDRVLEGHEEFVL